MSYLVRIDPVVDFREGFTNQWEPLWQDFFCEWRKLYFNEGIEPPSWVIGDKVLAAGAKGILFKSAITGRSNLVLYIDALSEADSIDVHDPNRALPKNQSSWE